MEVYRYVSSAMLAEPCPERLSKSRGILEE
jgi:hypothetical protein